MKEDTVFLHRITIYRFMQYYAGYHIVTPIIELNEKAPN